VDFEEYFLEQLRLEIRTMTPQSTLYKLLKEELDARGLWFRPGKGKPRGRAFPAGEDNPKVKAKKNKPQ
jgi:hypothetical protein